MGDGAPERDGVLLLRIWLEPTEPPSLRARVVAADPDRTATLVDRPVVGLDDVVDTVRQWLESLATPDRSPA